MRIPRYLLALLIAGFISSVGASPAYAQNGNVGKPLSEPPYTARIVGSQNPFGFKLLRELAKEKGTENQNIFISPISIHAVLMMALNGAGGKTRIEMAQALEIGGMPLEQANIGYSGLLASIMQPEVNTYFLPEYRKKEWGVRFHAANALWVDKTVRLKPDYVARLRRYFKAEATTLNLRSSNTAGTINEWVKQKTNGKITSIFSPQEFLSSPKDFVLLNAAYFRGAWYMPFSPKETQPGPFTLSDGTIKTVPMMSRMRSRDFPYLKGDSFQALQLHYSVGDDFRSKVSFYLFLPDKDSSLPGFLEKLTADNWNTWMGGFGEAEVNLKIPRFQFAYEADLLPSLARMGMRLPFSAGAADFSPMGAPRRSIDAARHKTYLSVDEEGTEAAAVTGLTFIGAAPPEIQEVDFIVDRPFFCVIRDDKTGAILFMGCITAP